MEPMNLMTSNFPYSQGRREDSEATGIKGRSAACDVSRKFSGSRETNCEKLLQVYFMGPSRPTSIKCCEAP